MSTKYEATGKIHFIGATETRGSFTFRKFVLETDGTSKYPQLVEFQTTKDNIDKLDTFNVGDELKVEFNLRGREWTSKTGEVKYFVTLDAWRFGAVGAAKSAGGQQAAAKPAASADEDLPF